MKILIGLIVVVALLSQTDIVKDFFRDASASRATFEQLANLYNNVEPKEQWNKPKCDEVDKIVNAYCAEFCTDGTGENCVAECQSDFEEEFQCSQFK